MEELMMAAFFYITTFGVCWSIAKYQPILDSHCSVWGAQNLKELKQEMLNYTLNMPLFVEDNLRQLRFTLRWDSGVNLDIYH